MDKNTKRLIGFTILITVLVLVGVFTLDYFNIFSGLGLNIKNINWDATTLIAGNIVVILLFVITYFIVDSRSIQKDKNQRMTAYLTLVGIYERCKDMVDIFSQEDLRTRAAQKCDGDKLLHEDKSHMHFFELSL